MGSRSSRSASSRGRRTGKKTGDVSVIARRRETKGSKKKSVAKKFKDSDGIYLDWDDTVSKYEGASAALYSKILKSYGHEGVSSDYVKQTGKYKSPKKFFMAQGMSEKDASEAAGTYRARAQSVRKDYKSYDKVAELIHLAKKDGKKTSIVTNSESKYVSPSLDALVDEYNGKFNATESDYTLFNTVKYKAGKPSSRGLKSAIVASFFSAYLSFLTSDLISVVTLSGVPPNSSELLCLWRTPWK